MCRLIDVMKCGHARTVPSGTVMAMARPTSNARQDLLASVITWVGDHGIGDVSLRTLAEAIGTSHRMLLFHFGSKEALWVEVVRAVEADQRAAMSAITTDESATIAEQMRSHWMGMLDPSLRNNIRLFFEVYADALRGRSYTKDFLDEVMSSWLPTVTAALQPVSAAPQSADPAGQEPQYAGSRWSADSWMLWRRGSRTRLAGGVLTPSYGASQAGSVLRYRLMRNSAHRPSAYLRITSALDSSAEREASLGLSARPFARIPLVAAAEARLTSTPGGRMIRPAGFIVTELPPLALPLGLRGEAYGQAGYVGGKFATPFADGQLRADRAFLLLSGFDVRLGCGVVYVSPDPRRWS